MRFFVFFLLAVELLGFDVTAVTENEPSTLVEGVSVITGDFCMHSPVYTVQGIEPIYLSDTYISEGWFFSGYEHYKAIWYEGNIYIREPYGTNITYIPDNKKKPNDIGERFYGDPKKKKHWKNRLFTNDWFISQTLGISNTASGDISARTHIKNHRIVFDHKRNCEGKSFSFYAADGTVRYYVKAISQKKQKFPGLGFSKTKSITKHTTIFCFRKIFQMDIRYATSGRETNSSKSGRLIARERKCSLASKSPRHL
jgi:hypothetical protein